MTSPQQYVAVQTSGARRPRRSRVHAATCCRSSLRSLEEIRHDVAVVSRMLAADRTAAELLCRLGTIRADLRDIQRRLLLNHARRSLEEMLPGEENAGTRRQLLALLESYARRIIPPVREPEPSRSGNSRGGSR